jgi:CRP-like cAMP-binding protein
MLTDAVVASITKDQIMAAVETHPRLTSALWWTTLVDEGIARAWLVNLGQRTAIARIASLFYELWYRARLIGLTDEGEFALPLTQEQLGEAVGLTSVHVNRVLRELRDLNLVKFRSRLVVISDVDQLMKIADFDPAYLQLQRRQDIPS